MSRVLLAMAVGLATMAMVRVLPVVFGIASVPLTPGAVVVAWAALVLPPLEAVVAASLCGLVVDALAGLPVGLSSFSLVVALLVARLGTRSIPRAVGPLASAFAGGVVLAVFAPERAPWQPGTLLLVGILDVGLALLLLPVLDRLGVLVGLERSTSTADRLAARL
jgi:hypothetical protein